MALGQPTSLTRKLNRCLVPFITLLFALLPSLLSSASAGVLLQHHFSYTVSPGDTLESIAARMGVSRALLAEDNGLDPAQQPGPGTELRINILDIVPETIERGLLVDIPGSMIHLFEAGIPVMSAAVGLGRPKLEGEKNWETPVGEFAVTGKLRNPDWAVPESIQEEMRREGLVVKESLPPGPKNPVGGYVLQTTLPGILIHDTIDPSSVGMFLSHGCVRLLRPEMEQLFEFVPKGTKGTISYRPVKVVQLSDGRVFMEVNQDIYARVPDLMLEAKTALRRARVSDAVDMEKVEAAVKAASGIPEDITAAKK